jgi:hypothetical protein
MHDHPRRGTPARPRRWRRPYLPALVGVLLALGVAACGGGSSDNGDGVASLVGADSATSTTTANAGEDVDPAQAARNYGRCMRQHGIDLPDPQVDADGGLDMEIPRSVNRDAPKFKAADQACGRYLPPRENAPPNTDAVAVLQQSGFQVATTHFPARWRARPPRRASPPRSGPPASATRRCWSSAVGERTPSSAPSTAPRSSAQSPPRRSR